jgi:hypothetical protein
MQPVVLAQATLRGIEDEILADNEIGLKLTELSAGQRTQDQAHLLQG